MSVANSAAQYPRAYKPGAGHTGRAACDLPRTPASFARRIGSFCSFSWRINSAFRPVMPTSVTFFQKHQFFNLYQNQRSILVRLNTPSTDRPARKASAMYQIRFQPASSVRDGFWLTLPGHRGSLVESSRTDFLCRAAFCRDSCRATNRHHFANRFHLSGQTVVSTSEFFEVEARNFSNHIGHGFA